ncbi:MAG: glycosyltransferase family 39 protein, partial [Candidatus Woesearchaeota archaeon]
GLLFFFITLIKILNENFWKWIWVGLSVAAAILSQQFCLVLIPAILLHIIFFDESDSKNKALKSSIFLITCLILILPIFIIWKG